MEDIEYISIINIFVQSLFYIMCKLPIYQGNCVMNSQNLYLYFILHVNSHLLVMSCDNFIFARCIVYKCLWWIIYSWICQLIIGITLHDYFKYICTIFKNH